VDNSSIFCLIQPLDTYNFLLYTWVMRISYSAFDTYQNCPLKYKFQQVDKIKTPKSKEAVFGTVLHDTMKFVHTPGILSPTLDQAMEHFANHWNPAVFDSPDEERAAFSQGVGIIQNYFKKNNPADFNIVNLESRFQIEIGNIEVNRNKQNDTENKSHIISGIIDRIDRTEDGFEIIDYKTTKKMPTQERVENDIQLSVYLKAFLSLYPQEIANLENIKVSLYFLKHNVKLSAQRSAEQLAETEKIFLETIDLIEEQKFEPNVSPLCDWCGYQNRCPMWKHKFKEARKIDTQEVNDAIDEYVNLKSAIGLTKDRLAKLQELITNYMEQEGVERVFGETGIIGQTVRKTYKYDEKKIKEILLPLNHWEDVLKVDGIALRNILGVLPLPARKEIEKAKTIDKETRSLAVKKK
jgi:putative RecB family exonuclease